MELTLHSLADMAPLETWTDRRPIRRVILDPALQTSALERLVRSINRDLRACGCIPGAICCLVALANLPWIVPMLRTHYPDSWTKVSLVAFAVVFGVTLAGKITGLVVANLCLLRNIRRLRASLGTAAS
jgi:hypothetical protein